MTRELNRDDCHLPIQVKKQLEDLIDVQLTLARQLSKFINGPQKDGPESTVDLPLADQEQVEALRIGMILQNMIRRRVDARLAAEISRLAEQVSEAVLEAVDHRLPRSGRWLTTKSIAKQLALAPKTVRKLCNQRLIDADKTAGGGWRTTEARLNGSEYLRRKR